MTTNFIFKCKPFDVPEVITLDYLNAIYEKFKIITLINILGINCDVTFEEEE